MYACEVSFYYGWLCIYYDHIGIVDVYFRLNQLRYIIWTLKEINPQKFRHLYKYLFILPKLLESYNNKG